MNHGISIRPSKDIRTNYAQISALTRQNPVAITVNGKEDTVLLSHEEYQEQLLRISELEASCPCTLTLPRRWTTSRWAGCSPQTLSLTSFSGSWRLLRNEHAGRVHRDGEKRSPEIAVHLAKRSGSRELAVRFVRELQEQTAILAQFPESGAFPQDRMLKSSGFRFLTHKDYLLLYRYERAEGRVYIMAIFHGRRNYLRVMQQYL